MTKIQDEENITIHRTGRSTYLEEKSVLTSGATPVNAACPIGEPSLLSSRCYNTAVGYDALSLDAIGGNYNTGVGFVVLYQNTTGYYNTASGAGALEQNTTGNNNTAFGFGALSSNIFGDNNTRTTGSFNTATGAQSLYMNTTGSDNTASGYLALQDNTTGSDNTATGAGALQLNNGGNNTATGLGALGGNRTGNNNTATGLQALVGNKSGIENTATGMLALQDNLNGNYNTATGFLALALNSSGGGNTASGWQALYSNTTGGYNTAVGWQALQGALSSPFATGSNNTGIGSNALYSYSTGSNNIAIGYEAGYNLTTGSNNIEIGNQGVVGDANTIKIGTAGTQTRTYIAGIADSHLRGRHVVISDDGQLGVEGSSARYKTDIAPMGLSTEKLDALRPATFRLKGDPQGPIQYGLIVEEVAKVYPELVIRDKQGRIDGVRYDELAPMLLKEVQKQAAEIRDLKKLVLEMQAGLAKLESKDELVAQR